ncbi:unnamed protein product [Calicophoron daubneyi]|uniref:Calponin-homology (CH) domain-containing protein n=1 Tax=Calicophoron daubneyi TaxID=300641 RepID=A0AAV2TDZ2_CALDB
MYASFVADMTSLAGLKSHDSILSKLDTFKRRKKERMEVEELTKESSEAIKISIPPLIANDPKDYQLQEGEERSFLEKSSKDSPMVQELINKLLTWINTELADERILVRDLQEDLYDGQILQKLVEKLASIKLEHPELTQSEIGQIQRLREVLATINGFLRTSPSQAAQKWPAELIHQKDLVAILRLLVALARHFKTEMRFQPGVFLTVIVARKLNGKLEYRYERQYVTEVTGPETGSHPFDVLSEHHMVVQALVGFVNAQLSQLDLEVKDLSKDLCDGVRLILLMGLLEGYFVPFYAYNPTPVDETTGVNNVKLAFELMQAAGMAEPPAQAEEIVNGDGKAILRVLYHVYSHYQRLEDEQRRYKIANIRELDEVEETAGSDTPAAEPTPDML